LDADRQVTTMEGKDLAKHWNCTFFEASALTRKNVDESFYETVRAIRREKNPEKVKGGNKKDKIKKKLEAKGCTLI
jgi:GTPase SAR1 family protein